MEVSLDTSEVIAQAKILVIRDARNSTLCWPKKSVEFSFDATDAVMEDNKPMKRRNIDLLAIAVATACTNVFNFIFVVFVSYVQSIKAVDWLQYKWYYIAHLVNGNESVSAIILATSLSWYPCAMICGVCASGIFLNMDSLNTDLTHILFSDEPYSYVWLAGSRIET
jgi:hypothetical protein